MSRIDQAESDIQDLTNRMDSMDRGLASTLRALSHFLSDIEQIVDPTVEAEDKAEALIRVRRFNAAMEGSSDD